MIKKIIIVTFVIFLLAGCSKYKEYKTSFSVFSSNVKVTIYEKNEEKARKAFSDIKQIYLKYESLFNQYNNLEISKELENALNIIINYTKKTKHVKFNSKIKNNKLINKDNNFKNYIMALANNDVYEYLKNKGISKFFINLNGCVLTGYPNNKEYFLVGISSPFDDSVIKMLEIKDEYVVTKNIAEINNDNLQDGSYNVSVTVITKNIKMGDFIALDLLLMEPNEAIEHIKNNNIQAILCYYKNGNEKIFINID